MRRGLWMVLPLLLLAGCASGLYQVPKEQYRQQVQVLGVLPLMVDAGSTLNTPDRQQVIDLLRRRNAGSAARLVGLLKKSKGYFDVRAVPGAPEGLFSLLVRDRSLQGDAASRHWHYTFNPTATARLTKDHAVDALLVVILNGVERSERRWDRLHLNYLDAKFNDIQATAYVVLPDGRIAWEDPAVADSAFLQLQYPDFDEAYYNKTEQVRIKSITPA
ncbi:MAG TPA: hypothetical protein VJ955_00635, partial [Desulfuromonadales bacterium]|nr:hypothetical protein [Desulfuromonadales bacterium]